jgi:carbon storage regulator
LDFFNAAGGTCSEPDGSWHETCKSVRHHENDMAGIARRQNAAIRNELKEEQVMLVLSRKLGQSFRVGPDVRVTIVKIDRNSVRIGIDAPDDISVKRQEIVFEFPRVQSIEAGAA